MCFGGNNPLLRALPFIAYGIVFGAAAILLFTHRVRVVNPRLLWAARIISVLLSLAGFAFAVIAYTMRLCG
jgi:hypothetical protein